MRVLWAFAALIISLFLNEPAHAAEGACPVHVVAEGDTLGDIAQRYYGVRGRADMIYRANLVLIGPDPDIIEDGQRLMLPCEGDAVLIAMPGGVMDKDEMAEAVMVKAGPDAIPEPMTEKPEMAEKAMSSESSLHILTGGPFAPFAGQDLPGGGMIIELLEVALAISGDGPHEFAFVNDRAAHLDLIAPRGGWALAAPWTYPDCSASDLGVEMQEICGTYIASNGFYEFVTEFYARADSEWATVILPGGLMNTRFCRPEGYPLHDLEGFGLLPDGVELVQAASPTECLQALDEGRVDIASMDAAVTRALVDRVEIANPIIVLESLTQINKLRVLAPRANPSAEALIARLNTALDEMSDDGRWYDIVNRHLRGNWAEPQG